MIMIEIILVLLCMLVAMLSTSLALGLFGAGPVAKKTCPACLKAANVEALACPHCQRDFPQLVETTWEVQV